MQTLDGLDPTARAAFPVLVAADLQDHLLTASHDLDRLQTLLSDACTTLMESFHGASDRMRALREMPAPDPVAFEGAVAQLSVAVTALQFQDMASQLITHTSTRLRNCVDRLARDAFADDEDGEAAVTAPPLRPNPVTQAEMDAGSVDLF